MADARRTTRSGELVTTKMIVIGDPVKGYRFFGPYRDGAVAVMAAQTAGLGDLWIIADLEPAESLAAS